jgi:hypothetical protein
MTAATMAYTPEWSFGVLSAPALAFGAFVRLSLDTCVRTGPSFNGFSPENPTPNNGPKSGGSCRPVM